MLRKILTNPLDRTSETKLPLPLATVVIAYLNERLFLREALDSVAGQVYKNWEVVLVDDGSTDESRSIAEAFQREHPGRVQCLSHPGRVNMGLPASRNVGIRAAQGEFVAFLDADDVWLPQKLEEQVSAMLSHPEVGMVYGQARQWFSWTGHLDDGHRDREYFIGVPTGVPLEPPSLVRPFFVTQTAFVPNPSSILVRRKVFDEVGGFEESFAGIYAAYEDQAFYAKVALATAVVALGTCSVLYRQHPGSITARGARAGHEHETRMYFLAWLADTLDKHGMSSIVVRSKLWSYRHPFLYRLIGWLIAGRATRPLRHLLLGSNRT